MKNLFVKLALNIENYKIYHIILLFTTVFIILFMNGFYHIREELKFIANQNRILMTKEIEYTISKWLEERVHHIENSIKYLANQKDLRDDKAVELFIHSFLYSNAFFETVQILLENSYFYVNDKKIHDYNEIPNFIGRSVPIEPTKTNWYVETKTSMKTTISVMEKHGVLLEKTMNICTPILASNDLFKGVLCGIIKVNSMFEKINELHFPQNSYYFIMDSTGSVLTSVANMALKNEIETAFKTSSHQTENVQKFLLDKDVITLTKVKDFDWYIGVGMSKEDIMQESATRVTKHAVILFLCFIVLLIIVNSAHTFLRKRVEKKQKEYEYILAHRSRISEIGKLISGINHQLKQPLNATALVVSNTLDMSERECLDKQTLEENLKLCQKSIALMDKTIGIFRNFYRCSEEITHFNLLDCIQGVLHVKHVDLSRHNIVVELNEKEISTIEVESIENYIQQILLVLIQNAQDALAIESINPLKKGIVQKIHLSVSEECGNITIEITDWGCGISKEMKITLFSEFKSSKKYEGSGIGLYFAKKLAQEKLMGNLVLHNCFFPTIFRLTFVQYLPHKKES